MKRFKYLAFLLWMMPLAFGACTDDDNDEITDEEYIAGAILISFMRKYQISDSPRSLIEGQRRFAIGIGRFRNFQSSLLQSYLRGK